MKKLVLSALLLTRISFADHTTEHAWEKMITPGAQHKQLAELAGKWNFSMKYWTAPETAAMESKGKSTAKMILGGRFLQEDVTSKMGKDTFTGLGLTGYDNFRGEYQGTWADSMSTAILTTTGKMENGVLKSEGTMSDPMSNDKSKWFRTEMHFADKNTHTYAMYTKDAKGAEFKAMEIVYTRAK